MANIRALNKDYREMPYERRRKRDSQEARENGEEVEDSTESSGMGDKWVERRDRLRERKQRNEETMKEFFGVQDLRRSLRDGMESDSTGDSDMDMEEYGRMLKREKEEWYRGLCTKDGKVVEEVEEEEEEEEEEEDNWKMEEVDHVEEEEEDEEVVEKGEEVDDVEEEGRRTGRLWSLKKEEDEDEKEQRQKKERKRKKKIKKTKKSKRKVRKVLETTESESEDEKAAASEVK